MFVVIGTTTLDLIVRTPDAGAAQLDDGFRASNVVFCTEPLLMLLGGNGGNSAYVLGGLGERVALLGAIGDDTAGQQLVKWLQQRDVELEGLVVSDQASTSSSTVVLAGNGAQRVYHHKGATEEMDFLPRHEPLLEEAGVLLVSSLPLFPRMRAGGLARALRLARAAGAVTAVDIGPAIGEPVQLGELVPLLPDVDYLLANEHELAVCTGEQAWAVGAARVLAAGARHVVVKRGSAGAALLHADKQVEVTAFAIPGHLSVGAGDAFNGAFLLGVRQGLEDEAALRLGSAVAALTIVGDRGVLGAPGLDDVEAFLHERRA